MTTTEFENLTKGQLVFQPYIYDGKARVSQCTFEGVTAGGQVKYSSRFTHKETKELFRRLFFVTKREAAECLMSKAQKALDEAQAAFNQAQAILAATSTLE